MGVVVYIPGFLRTFTEGAGRVELGGSPATVGGVLEALWARHPGVRDRVVDELGRVRTHVNVFVDEESIRYSGGLETPVRDGCAISIVPAVSGG